MRRPTFALVAAAALVVYGSGCSGDSAGAGGAGAAPSSSQAGAGSPSSTGSDAGSGGGSTGSRGSSTGAGAASSTGAGAAGGNPGGLGGPFGRGVNFGYVPGFTDTDMATLAHDAGANGSRESLPDSFLAQWGAAIRVPENMNYVAMGMTSNVCFLTGPTAAESTAPNPGSDDLDFYIPKNLHTDIFLGDGSVNPDNYWAVYVQKVVSTYKDYIKIWSVWNEPDWVSDYHVTATWDTMPPTAAQLPRFNGSIFDYVRMLRITTAVAKKVDPEAKVAVGGLGYSGFLGAILRYTDNPTDGSVDADHPDKGDAYFDVLDIHYYPIFTPGSSDAGIDGFHQEVSDFRQALADGHAGAKEWIVTESGAPHVVTPGNPGGDDYARNYLLKIMTSAAAEGISRVDWFILTDGADTSTDPFQSMGLYHDLTGLTSVADAVKTDTGWAYTTFGTNLPDARYDPTETAALALPEAIRGAAFRATANPTDKRAWVLWARADAASETGAATFTVPTSGSLREFDWDAAKNGNASTLLPPTSGGVQVTLDASPRIFLEN